MQYYFILGKNPFLSKAEISAVLALKNIKFNEVTFNNNVLVIEVASALDVDWLNNRLAGTIKIGTILDKVSKLEEFSAKFFKLIKFGQGKTFFGFSLYAIDPAARAQKLQRQLTPLAMEIKRKLREDYKLSSRYVVSREIELSSVIVKKNKLLQNGAEICFFIKAGEILVGQTLAVQLFEEFGARDFTRPGRDDVSGMLPPKLARMMINLAQLPEAAIIVDPFCGSGTIIQEALLMGYKNLQGFDISPKAIGDTTQNLHWLASKYEVAIKQVKIAKTDVLQLNKEIKANTVDAIITEPFLGPALSGHEPQAKIEEIIESLQKLYLGAFKVFMPILKKSGKIVIITPIFNTRSGQFGLELNGKISQLGFKLISSDALKYYRPNQSIWRLIQIWQKQ